MQVSIVSVMTRMSMSMQERKRTSLGMLSWASPSSLTNWTFLNSFQSVALKFGCGGSVWVANLTLRCVSTGMWSDLAGRSSGKVFQYIVASMRELEMNMLSGLV